MIAARRARTVAVWLFTALIVGLLPQAAWAGSSVTGRTTDAVSADEPTASPSASEPTPTTEPTSEPVPSPSPPEGTTPETPPEPTPSAVPTTGAAPTQAESQTVSLDEAQFGVVVLGLAVTVFTSTAGLMLAMGARDGA